MTGFKAGNLVAFFMSLIVGGLLVLLGRRPASEDAPSAPEDAPAAATVEAPPPVEPAEPAPAAPAGNGGSRRPYVVAVASGIAVSLVLVLAYSESDGLAHNFITVLPYLCVMGALLVAVVSRPVTPAVTVLVVLAVVVGTGQAVVGEDEPLRSRPGSAAVAASPAPARPAPAAQPAFVPRDLAATAGIAWSGPTAGESCVFDYDRDGVDDLLLPAGSGAWQLYRGRPGGRFARTNAGTFGARDRQGCAAGDFDGDSRLDVYTSAGELWIQGRDGTFAERSAEFGLPSPDGRGRQPVALDANADDRPDLFTSTATDAGRNRLWHNEGGERLVAAPALPDASIGVGCGTAGDVDEDGDDELIVCGGQDGDYFLSAYETRGGRWSQATAALALPKGGRADAELGHMDGDGRLDLILVSPAGLEIRLNRDGRFPAADFALPLQAGRDVAIADADGDGNRDIYVVQAKNAEVPDLLLLNGGDGKRFTKVAGMPRAGGEGDSVQALPDFRGTRRAGFLVSNGAGSEGGPRMLVQLAPAG